jgi:fatty-acyl-CoA synthase
VLDLLALPPGPPAPAIGTAQDALLLVYTSGTTGRPKGAVLDQRAVQGNALNSLHMHQLTAADRVLTALPMFHVGGLNIQTLPALYAGAEVLLLAAFDAEAWLVAVATGQATLSLMVPATMRAVLRHPDWAATDLSSLRAIGAGSSEVPVALIEPFHARGVPVQQVYGATETGPIALYQSAAEAIAAPGSLGRPALHAEVRVVDEAGAPCPPGVPGEIEVRGDATLRRYWGMAEPVLRDGWFATGDLGQVDAGGRWWFAGRRSDVIISGGENIWPAELERVLETAPGVLECAVCGRADPVWGEVPVAVLVVEPGFAEAAALAHTAVRLARFKQPRALLPVPALPRTALGKVDRAALRAMVG